MSKPTGRNVNVVSADTERRLHRVLNQIENLTVVGLKWTPSENNAVLEIAEEGGGVPEGYVEQSVILCVSGSPVSGTILFKEDAP